jgi:fumarate reductase flavoprotein subunit
MTAANQAPDYDVIVIGAGGAGLSAAAMARKAGASVLLVEAAAKVGGSTCLSGGVFYAAGTSLQREAGVADPGPEDMYRYYMTLNQYKLEASVVRRLCFEAPAAFEWLRSLGIMFRVEDLYAAGVDKIRRGHRAAGGGAAIAEGLEGSLDGVDVVVDTRVERLLWDASGVHGIEVDGAAVRAHAVVLATGGFGASPEKLARLYPDATQHGDLHWYIGAQTCRGDGLDLGQSAGGVLTRPNRGMLLLTPGFVKDLESYLPGWLMMVDAHGHRFIDETIEYSVLASVVNELPRRECYAIFDEASRQSSRTTAYRSAPSWTADRLEQSVADGTLLRADSLADLAALIDVPPGALEAAAARYGDCATVGEDADFFKPATMLRPIAEAPFYAARIRAAIVCWTGTGLRIDQEARVLDRSGLPVAGLFAAGETTGGMFGECYAAGGASIGNAVVFGRIAGANAAKIAAAGGAAVSAPSIGREGRR